MIEEAAVQQLMTGFITRLLTIIGVGLGVLFGIYILYTEVLYPFTVVVRKKREGGAETVIQRGRFSKDKDGNMFLYMNKEKTKKALNDKYNPSITTGLVGRRRYLFELYSPKEGDYFFTKGVIANIKEYSHDLISQSDRQMMAHAYRKATYLTPNKQTNWERIMQIANIAMPIVVVIAIAMLMQVLKKDIISMFAEAANVFVERVTAGIGTVQGVP